MVLMIELENALAQMATNAEPTKLWSPYRQPLAKFLNKYTSEVRNLAFPWDSSTALTSDTKSRMPSESCVHGKDSCLAQLPCTAILQPV